MRLPAESAPYGEDSGGVDGASRWRGRCWPADPSPLGDPAPSAATTTTTTYDPEGAWADQPRGVARSAGGGAGDQLLARLPPRRLLGHCAESDTPVRAGVVTSNPGGARSTSGPCRGGRRPGPRTSQGAAVRPGAVCGHDTTGRARPARAPATGGRSPRRPGGAATAGPARWASGSCRWAALVAEEEQRRAELLDQVGLGPLAASLVQEQHFLRSGVPPRWAMALSSASIVQGRGRWRAGRDPAGRAVHSGVDAGMEVLDHPGAHHGGESRGTAWSATSRKVSLACASAG